LAGLHEDFRFIVSVAIAHSLDGFVEVVGSSVGIHIHHFDGEVGVFHIRRYVDGRRDRAAYLCSFSKWFGGVDQYVGTFFDLPLIERAAEPCRIAAYTIASQRGNRIQWVIGKGVWLVCSAGFRRQCAVTVKRVGSAATR